MTPIEDRLLAIDLSEAEQDPLERRRWRQYACAALSNIANLDDKGCSINAECLTVAQYADLMLEQERKRFEKVMP